MSKLFDALYPDQKDSVSEAELNKMYRDLFKKAKKDGLYLLGTEKGSSESISYRFLFKVYQKKSGKKCPWCGQCDTVKITYGNPEITDALKEDKKHHRIYI